MDRSSSATPSAPGGMVRRKKKVRVYPKRITLKWFLAILAAAVLVSLFLIAFGRLFDSLEDKTYRPKDIERQYHELQKMKEAVEKEQLPARNSR